MNPNQKVLHRKPYSPVVSVPDAATRKTLSTYANIVLLVGITHVEQEDTGAIYIYSGYDVTSDATWVRVNSSSNGLDWSVAVTVPSAHFLSSAELGLVIALTDSLNASVGTGNVGDRVGVIGPGTVVFGKLGQPVGATSITLIAGERLVLVGTSEGHWVVESIDRNPTLEGGTLRVDKVSALNSAKRRQGFENLGFTSYANLTAANLALGIGKLYYDLSTEILEITTA